MMKETLKTVLAVPGVSGSEHEIVKTLAELVRPFVDEMRTDALGNLICVKHGEEGGKRILLSAHMDQIGYVVIDADKEGFLWVHNVGGVPVKDAAGRAVTFQNGVQGVVYAQPTKEKEERKISDLYIDIGASTKEEALEKVALGDTASVTFHWADMGDRVAAPTMDDRAACAVLVELLQALQAPHHTVIAVFSSQEEVGLRGARAAAFSEEPDIGIAVDVTSTGDTPEAPRMAVKLGAGPTVKIMDRASITTPSVREGLIAAAKAANVPFQREVLTFGGTDAGAIQASRGGIPAGTVSIPTRYIHSPVEMVSIRDMEQTVALLAKYLSTIH